MSIIKTDEIQARTSGNRVVLPDVNNYPPFRNLIINGDMSIAQRGTSFSLTSGNSKFPVDRFKVFTEGSFAYTVSQSTDVPTGQGFYNSIKVDVTTGTASPNANSQSILQTNLEGQMLQQLKKGTSNAESLTLSFWVKSTATGNMQVNLRDLDNARIIANTFTVNSANTWEKKTLTFAGDTTGAFANDNGASLRIGWMLGTGSDYTSGAVPTSWEAFSNGDKNAGDTMNFSSSASNDLYITGVQLEVGTSASDFEFLPRDINLQRCQRYFYQIQGNDSANTNLGIGFCNNSSSAQSYLKFPTTMRSTPSITSSSGVQTSDGNSYTKSATGVAVDSGSTISMHLAVAASSMTVFRGCFNTLTASSSSHIAFSSEL